jgi:RNA polymerase sigma factor (sigma-70 family)
MSRFRDSDVIDVVAADSGAEGTEFSAAAADPTDDHLLNEYCTKRDESAFAMLVHRHGPLVWRVCRRVLGASPDAEDAFQATFVVLVRRAGSVRWKRSIAGWLYQVAWRVARRSRTQIARRAAVTIESHSATAGRTPAAGDDDRRRTVEEEISRLPESLRLPIVLCYMQGLTNIEAANRIGCPEGTVASRLARARERLRRRLRARGIAMVGAAALIEALASGTSAALAPALEKATVVVAGQLAAGAAAPAVLSLAGVRLGDTVARLLSWQRLIQCGAAVVLGTAIVGSVLTFQLGLWSTEREPDAVSTRAIGNAQWLSGQAAPGMTPADRGANVGATFTAMEALQGRWVLDEWHLGGQEMAVTPEEQYVEFAGGRCLLVNITGNDPGPVIADAILDPRNPTEVFDLVLHPDDQPHRVHCIYTVTGDTLRLSIGYGRRPGSLDSQRGDPHHSYTFKRAPASSRTQPPPSPD